MSGNIPSERLDINGSFRGGSQYIGNVFNAQSINFGSPSGIGADEKVDVLKFLKFEDMHVKRDQANPKTSISHEWIWKTSFPDWLRSSKNDRSCRPFWICGKAGSGKSTLVAYLINHTETRRLLQESLDGSNVGIVHFFYNYRFQETTANNILGMLRMLLYQVAESVVDVRARLQDLLDRDELNLDDKEALLLTTCDVLRQTHPLCLFLDGLDEYHGGHTELLDVCRRLKDGTATRLCLACRPDVDVSGYFDLFSTVVMQDHNTDAMLKYAERQIRAAREKDLNIAQKCNSTLLKILVNKAQGIILWFKLAFDDLLEKCIDGSSDQEIEQLVNNIPAGLDAMYERILDMIPSKHRPEASLLLFLNQRLGDIEKVTIPNTALFMEAYSTTDLDHLWGTYDFIAERTNTPSLLPKYCDRRELHDRIELLLHGLLEFHSFHSDHERKSSGSTNMLVNFIHRSFGVYLEKTKWPEHHISKDLPGLCTKPFWLRLFSDIILQASSDNAITTKVISQLVKELTPLGKAVTSFEEGNLMGAASSILRFHSHLFLRKSMYAALCKEFFPHPEEVSLATSARPTSNLPSSVEKFITSQYYSMAPDLNLPLVWKSRHVILRTAFLSLFLEAQRYERSGSSSYNILRDVMATDLGCLIAVTSTPPDYESCNQIKFSFTNHQESRGILGLLVAMLANMPLYIMDNLVELNLTDWQRDKLHDAMMDIFVHHSPNLETARNSSLDMQCLRAMMTALKYPAHPQDLSNAMISAFSSGDAALTVQTLKDFLTRNLPSEATTASSSSRDTQNLLFAWARMRCRHKPHAECCKRDLHARNYNFILNLLVSYGCDVNDTCYQGGTVLQAILDAEKGAEKTSFPARFVTWRTNRRAKFLALVKAGLDPKRGDGLKAAINCKQRITTGEDSWRTLNTNEEKYKYKTNVTDIDFIIECLHYHQQHGRWSEDLIDEASRSTNPEQRVNQSQCSRDDR